MRQKVSVTTYLTFSLAKTKHALGIRMPPFSFGDSDMTDQRKGSDAEPTTHFGFKNVPESQKAEKVAEVFHSVAAKYDLMIDVLSGGMHRLWKRFTIELSGVRTGNRVLDIAGGTGDLAAKFSKLVGPTGQVVLADINGSMLKVGRDRLLDKGVAGNIEFVQADAEKLPFPDNHFDCVTIAFGLRNVTHKEDAIRSMLRVLKPGGRLLLGLAAALREQAEDMAQMITLEMGKPIAQARAEIEKCAQLSEWYAAQGPAMLAVLNTGSSPTPNRGNKHE